MASSRRAFLKQAAGGVVLAFQEVGKSGATPGSGLPPDAQNNPPQNLTSYTRGVGVYPGDPIQDFAPRLIADSSTYRNLALHRPAYHSSSYDYNLTAQLVTDGIKETRLPRWVATSASFHGAFPKEEREFFLDHNPTSVVELRGASPWVQIELGGGDSVPEIDRIDVLAVVQEPELRPEDLSFAVSVSDNGWHWTQVGKVSGPEPASVEGYPLGFARPGQLFKPSIRLQPSARSRFYRIELGASIPPLLAFGLMWQVGQVAFFNGDKRVQIGGPYNFTSAWMSAGSGEEWVYVDLGARFEFDRVVLSWIAKPAEGSLQVSDDAENWKEIQALPAASTSTDDFHFSPSAQGRYVGVLMKRPSSPYGYILSEIEVYGRGGFVSVPKPAPPLSPAGRIELAGGNWRLQRDSLVSVSPEKLSTSGFSDANWVVATVPGTVLSSYLNIGALPDPNYGSNQLLVSDSFFYADFWYRTEFTAPQLAKDQRAWLNFEGINWKAEVYLNGATIGRIDGGFIRGRFDVSSHLLAGQNNAVAVRVNKNDTPGSVKQKTFATTGKNGGALGLDNPTFHASIGWDWIPTIRGRNTGIWDRVYLEVTGPVTLDHPHVSTRLPLPETSPAEVTIEVDVVNHASQPVSGTLRADFGELKLNQAVRLGAGTTTRMKLDSSTHSELRIANPKLWWPAGYGEPNLYDTKLAFELDGGEISDAKTLQAGLRQMTYSEEGGALRIWINGRRFIAKGGNWGFSESLLRFREREYDATVRYHREMNFTMIRNWVGQAGEDAFYDACDRHGVMVWEDFWLANPWDGPDPKDDAMFMRNVKDKVLRIRNHPSLGLYCGRNEGHPPPPLEDGIQKVLNEFHPDIHYIPSSAQGVVGGGGPYMAMPIDFYFTAGSAEKLHSEMGMPNIPPIESVRAMLPASGRWPQGLDWGLHDFCLEGAQNGDAYRRMLDTQYGGADTLEEWIALAQFINYEGYRAMFEGQSQHRMGLLLWMSHPCWPSFVWQTYDYYLDPTAAYFGCKKACEPLHIQWNPVSDRIEVVNYSAGHARGLTAVAEIFNMDGTRKWRQSAPVDSMEDSTVPCIQMEYPENLTPVHFLRLTLSGSGQTLSANDYMRARESGNYRAIRELPKVPLQAATRAARRGPRWVLSTDLYNPSAWPALLVRLKAVRQTSGDRILPAIYEDNYVTLMAGERRAIRAELAHADTRGEKPRIVVEGFNVRPVA